MDSISIVRANADAPSIIYFDEYLSRLQDLADTQKCILITNQRLLRLYGDWIKPYRYILVEEGEANKNLTTVESIHRQLLSMGADRGTRLVGFGGGIITDITGFAASTFMRGVAFGFVATTLLAQVDASVGGKNGVNLDGYKNIIGTFNQPDWVLCSRNVLDTLPERELRAGYAEIIKCGLLRSEKLFNQFRVGEIDLRSVVRRSVHIKAEIVVADEREGGVRKLLNLGHTFAHGIEKCSGGRYLHGEAVAIGLVMAARGSVRLGLMECAEADDIERIIYRVGLPVSCDEIGRESLAAAMCSDKKKSGESIDFIFLEGIGRAVVRAVKVSDILTLL